MFHYSANAGRSLELMCKGSSVDDWADVIARRFLPGARVKLVLTSDEKLREFGKAFYIPSRSIIHAEYSRYERPLARSPVYRLPVIRLNLPITPDHRNIRESHLLLLSDHP